MRKRKITVDIKLSVVVETKEPNTPFNEKEFIAHCDVNGNKRLLGSGFSEVDALESLKIRFREWAQEHLFW